MKQTDILSLTVCGLADALRRRELSAADVTEAYLASADVSEPAVNAYITRTPDLARAQAILADERIRTGDIPPLCGIPYAVKDNIAVRDVPLTCASDILAGFVPPYSATVVERVAASGGVLLGKTNLDEFAMGSSCEKSAYGATHNPLDRTKSPGGSSGGSAAAVAVPSAAWAVGTDTGGSARQPAAFCGLCAMKPTYGLVSRYGLTEFASSLDTVCPITRDVRDNAYILEVLAGRDKRDMTTLGVADTRFTEDIENGVRGLKIALVKGYEAFVDPVTVRCVERTAGIFRKLGADVVTVDVPCLGEAVEIYLTVAAAEASSNLARYDGIRYGNRRDGASVADIMKHSRSGGFGEEVKRRILTGTYVLSSVLTGDYYRRIKAAQAEVCRRIYEMFEKIDILLMPTTNGIAFDLDSFNENPTDMYGSDRFTVIGNLTGCPAISIPGGVDEGTNLPVGVMLMGGRLSEKILYRAAYAAEAELGEEENK